MAGLENEALPCESSTDDPPPLKNDMNLQQKIEEMIEKKIERFDTPYDAKVEVLPSMAAYHTSFTKVENRYDHPLAKATEMPEGPAYQDTSTKRLLNVCYKHRKVQYPLAGVVGLIGDQSVSIAPHLAGTDLLSLISLVRSNAIVRSPRSRLH